MNDRTQSSSDQGTKRENTKDEHMDRGSKQRQKTKRESNVPSYPLYPKKSNEHLQLPPSMRFYTLQGEEELENHIYKYVLPYIESAGLLLSEYGNHNSPEALDNCDASNYFNLKDQKKLFEASQVLEAIQIIPSVLKKSRSYISSYTLKHIVERACTYKANGNVVIALLLLGYRAKIGGKHYGMPGNPKVFYVNPGFLLQAN